MTEQVKLGNFIVITPSRFIADSGQYCPLQHEYLECCNITSNHCQFGLSTFDVVVPTNCPLRNGTISVRLQTSLDKFPKTVNMHIPWNE